MAELDKSVPCAIEVRRNSDGEIRIWHNDWWGSDFIWHEGSYACDCNRHLFFLWAVGEDEDEDAEDFPCSDGIYSVRITTSDGRTVYDDFDKVRS